MIEYKFTAVECPWCKEQTSVKWGKFKCSECGKGIEIEIEYFLFKVEENDENDL
jgi:hypothetical protein